MKRLISTGFIVLLLAVSCKDEDSPDIGYVTGPDMRECVCCGGYFIDIKNETYRFSNDELPEGSINFNLIDAKFPIKVLVWWKPKKNSCLGDEITISKLQVIN